VLHIPGDENVSVRAILWRQSGSERLLTRGAKGGRGIDLKKVVSEFGHGAAEKRVTEVKDPSMQQQLLVLEEQEGFVHCKFGVCFRLLPLHLPVSYLVFLGACKHAGVCTTTLLHCYSYTMPPALIGLVRKGGAAHRRRHVQQRTSIARV
jgi:hypothetical protein